MKEESKIEQAMKKEMRNQHGIENISINDELSTLGMDSLDEVEMIMFIEDEFDIEISDEDAESWKTLQDVINYVEGEI